MASAGECEAARAYPLHWAVWNNDLALLKTHLEEAKVGLESVDPRGRTPLMLAVTLGRLEAAGELLKAGADATAEKAYWSVHHEAVSSGDPSLVQLVLQHREAQRARKTRAVTAALLRRLRDTPDFYAEMSWEFASWLPFVANMCPSDTYKVYKCGSFVRVDATLIGFDSSNQWQRGKQSFLFKGSEDGQSLQIIVVDHERTSVSIETVATSELDDSPERLQMYKPSEEEVASRLTTPLVTTYVDVDAIAFERSRSGFLWKGDREESVNEYPCKVFSASNVELVTKTRKEHLSQRDRDEVDNRNSTPMDSLLKFVQGAEVREEDKVDESGAAETLNPIGLSPNDYFDTSVDSLGLNRDIGRPKEVSKRSQSFKANLWLCEDFPLDLQEQITPIIDLMAVNNAHFQRLKNFIELQLPSGFPVKIEIPLFHVINAKITFGNINALRRPVDGVTTGDPGLSSQRCILESRLFEIPPHYRKIGGSPNLGLGGPDQSRSRHARLGDEDEMILQWAIQQSLAEEGRGSPARPQAVPVDIDADLQRAIQASLGLSDSPPSASGSESSLVGVLELSRREEEERVRRLQAQEDEDLRLALEASLKDGES